MKRRGMSSRLFSRQKRPIIKLRVFEFQENPATGTMGNPSNINDNDTTNFGHANVNEYAVVEFPAVREVSQYRHWGHAWNTGMDGLWTLEYQRFDGDTWHAFATFLTTGAVWSNWISFTPVYASAFRLYCTTADSGMTKSHITELKIKG